MANGIIMPGDAPVSKEWALKRELGHAKEAISVMQGVIDAHSTELSAMRVLLLQALGENEHNEAHAIEAVTYLKARQEAQRRFNAQREAKNGR